MVARYNVLGMDYAAFIQDTYYVTQFNHFIKCNSHCKISKFPLRDLLRSWLHVVHVLELCCRNGLQKDPRKAEAAKLVESDRGLVQLRLGDKPAQPVFAIHDSVNYFKIQSI